MRVTLWNLGCTGSRSRMLSFTDGEKDYVLTNAHRRRALLKLNLRELYHVSRLREDATAQWEIRRTAAEMSRLARRAMPLAGLLLGGKDSYPELFAKIFGRTPKMIPPKIFHS